MARTQSLSERRGNAAWEGRAAHLMGVHPETLKAVEAGKVPRLDVQQRIAQSLMIGRLRWMLWPADDEAAA